jgi:hypothetical protein
MYRAWRKSPILELLGLIFRRKGETKINVFREAVRTDILQPRIEGFSNEPGAVAGLLPHFHGAQAELDKALCEGERGVVSNGVRVHGWLAIDARERKTRILIAEIQPSQGSKALGVGRCGPLWN